MGACLYLLQKWCKGAPKIYYFWNNTLEWESTIFTLGLNIAKSTNYIEECFDQKLSKIKFPTKTLLDAYVYLPQ